MKILVTGITGQLGYDVMKELKVRGYTDIVGTGKNDLDITKERDVRAFILSYRPDSVIHCAAWTAVDLAEDAKELSYAVNVNGTRYVAEAVKAVNAKMVYISTDYVFSGGGDKPYQTFDQAKPISWYGKTKYLGELAVKGALSKYFIVRTSWVFGINGNNFVTTMLRLRKERGCVGVVSDQIGSPTYTADLAKLLCDMIETDKYGTYHATNEGFCSRYEFAQAIYELAGQQVQVEPLLTEEYPVKAQRPKNSRLSKDCLTEAGFSPLPPWHAALQRYLKELDVLK